MLQLDLLQTDLSGIKVRLEALTQVHREPLRHLAKDERIWRFYPLQGADDAIFDAWFDESMLEMQRRVTWPYAVIDRRSDKIVGTTRYEFIVADHDRLSIGGSWLHPDAWGTGYNPDMRYLLLSHAFESLRTHRVEIRVDGRNARNLSAWRSFGATEEGLLRQIFRTADGFRADRVVFSILTDEWPAVREKLLEKRSILDADSSRA